jgi:hypothetical protein
VTTSADIFVFSNQKVSEVWSEEESSLQDEAQLQTSSNKAANLRWV